MLRLGRITKFAVSLYVLIFCFALCGVGQTPVSPTQVDGYYSRAREICRSTPYRVKTTIEDRASEEAPWRWYSQSVTEYAGGNSYHIGKNFETITFERTTYIRQPSGGWKKKVPVETSATVRQLGPPVTEWFQEATPESTNGETIRKIQTPPVIKWVQQKVDGALNANLTFLSETWAKVKYLSDGLIFEHHNTGKVVFDELGRYVLTESITFEPRRRIFIKRLEEFEYDESIRIESPIK